MGGLSDRILDVLYNRHSFPVFLSFAGPTKAATSRAKVAPFRPTTLWWSLTRRAHLNKQSFQLEHALASHLPKFCKSDSKTNNERGIKWRALEPVLLWTWNPWAEHLAISEPGGLGGEPRGPYGLREPKSTGFSGKRCCGSWFLDSFDQLRWPASFNNDWYTNPQKKRKVNHH